MPLAGHPPSSRQQLPGCHGDSLRAAPRRHLEEPHFADLDPQSPRPQPLPLWTQGQCSAAPCQGTQLGPGVQSCGERWGWLWNKREKCRGDLGKLRCQLSLPQCPVWPMNIIAALAPLAPWMDWSMVSLPPGKASVPAGVWAPHCGAVTESGCSVSHCLCGVPGAVSPLQSLALAALCCLAVSEYSTCGPLPWPLCRNNQGGSSCMAWCHRVTGSLCGWGH